MAGGWAPSWWVVGAEDPGLQDRVPGVGVGAGRGVISLHRNQPVPVLLGPPIVLESPARGDLCWYAASPRRLGQSRHPAPAQCIQPSSLARPSDQSPGAGRGAEQAGGALPALWSSPPPPSPFFPQLQCFVRADGSISPDFVGQLFNRTVIQNENYMNFHLNQLYQK